MSEQKRLKSSARERTDGDPIARAIQNLEILRTCLRDAHCAGDGAWAWARLAVPRTKPMSSPLSIAVLT